MRRSLIVLIITAFILGIFIGDPIVLKANNTDITDVNNRSGANKIETITIQAQMEYGQTEARSMLAMINDFRTGKDAWAWNYDNSKKNTYSNLSKLSYDYELEKIAMQRAAEIAISFSHTRPNGDSCFSLYDDMAGENIAVGSKTAKEAFEQWLESDDNYSGQGHRRNMLENHKSVAIGHVYFHGTHYWVQEFGYSLSKTPKTQANDSATIVNVKATLSSCNITAYADVDTISITSDESKDLPSVYLYVTTGDTFSYDLDYVNILEADWSVSETKYASVSGNKLYGVSSGITSLEMNVGDRTLLSIPVSVSDGNCSHVFGEGVITKEATCIKNGQIKYICSTCGYTYYDSIAPSGHNWDDGTVSADGFEIKFRCKECGVDYSSQDIHKEATIYLDGSYSYTTAYKLLQAFNAKRKAKGLNSVIMDKELLALGMKHASDLTVCRSNTQNPDGTPFNIERGCGLISSYTWKYENALDNICNNLQDYKDCCSMGIGIFIQNEVYYMCVIFNTKPENFATEVPAGYYNDKKLTIEIPIQGNSYDFSLESYNKDTGKEDDYYSFKPGEKKYLRVINWPAAIINPRSYSGWKSSNPSVITVDSNGCITGVKDGNAVIYCRLGDYIIQRDFDVYDDNLHLSNIYISSDSYSYNGKQIRPSVTVDNENHDTVPSSCYTVKYGTNVDVGKGKITVTGKGNYKGTIKKTFKILPKGTKLTKVKGKKRSLVITWKKQPKQIDGYEIQYHIGKKFAQTNKIIRINNPATVKKVIKKLKKGKRYCVRIRTYKKLKVNTYYSTWSKTLTTLVK